MKIHRLPILLLVAVLWGTGGQVFSQEQDGTAAGQSDNPSTDENTDDEEPDCE